MIRNCGAVVFIGIDVVVGRRNRPPVPADTKAASPAADSHESLKEVQLRMK
jgi:hypothetical protein